MFDCKYCGIGTWHYPDCTYFEEVCGYFKQCPTYNKNGICEHQHAPLYKERVRA